jgi:hypothetical protein
LQLAGDFGVQSDAGDEDSPVCEQQTIVMKLLIAFLLWCGLFLLCWPLALLALLVYPLVWLVSLPFRLIGITLGAVFALLKTLLYLPARLLGYRPR